MSDSSKNSSKKWIASSFEDFGFESVHNDVIEKSDVNRAIKRKSSEIDRIKNKFIGSHTVRKSSTNLLWVEQYSPMRIEELAVHKKKIEEVVNWIEYNISCVMLNQKCGLLLLNGPSGAGKSATVRCIAHDYKIEIHEWNNPQGTNQEYGEGKRHFSEFDYKKESDTKLFKDFLLRVNRYKTLQLNNEKYEKKIILIEELPTKFIKEPNSFQDIIREYYTRSKTPLIFIVSDCANSEISERKIFPPDFQSELKMTTISFNPIAASLLSKSLQKIAIQEKKSLFDKDELENIIAGCSGDIRAAINSLQFMGNVDKHDIGKKALKNTKSKKDSVDQRSKKAKSCPDKDSSGSKDETLILFHAVGKVLYCKRLPEINDVEQKLPAHLSHCSRYPLLENPEQVIEKTQVSSPFFLSFLQQNYLDFFNDINDVALSSEYVSDSDFLCKEWSNKNSLEVYASSIATRGLMYSNKGLSNASLKKKFRPFHKPHFYTYLRNKNENYVTLRSLFKSNSCTPEESATQIIPFSIKCLSTSNHAHKEFVGKMCKFKYSSSHVNTFTEKDTDIDEPPEAHDNEYCMDSITNSSELCDFEVNCDDLIEDFDD